MTTEFKDSIRFQPGDAFLCSYMTDAQDDGTTGLEDGLARFISPFPSRIKSIGLSIDASGGIDNPTMIQVQEVDNTALTTLEPASSTYAIGVAYCKPVEPGAGSYLDDLKLFEVASDGSPAGTSKAYTFVNLERAGPARFGTNCTIFPGEFLTGATTEVISFPIPFDGEIVDFQLGIGETTTASWTASVFKNVSSVTTITIAANPAGTTSRPTAGNSPLLSANRFVKKGDYIMVTATGVASAAGKHPFNVVVRKI